MTPHGCLPLFLALAEMLGMEGEKKPNASNLLASKFWSPFWVVN